MRRPLKHAAATHRLGRHFVKHSLLFCRIWQSSAITPASSITLSWASTSNGFGAGLKGDRYGIAHRRAIGEIWAYWAAAIFPCG